MESRELCSAQKAMEGVAHFVEKRDYVVVPHQRWPFRRWFRQIGNHHSSRILALAVLELVARIYWEYRRVGVFKF
jgi:hypothetical protein